MLQPCVVMSALNDGLITEDQLRELRALNARRQRGAQDEVDNSPPGR